MSERKIKVSCGEVTLQLTLTSKLLAKSFEEAVLKPFLKAYSKRTDEDADVNRVARVEVDEEMLGDHSIPASVVLLARETVSAEVFLRPLEVEQAMRANELISDPFAVPPAEVMRGGASAGGRTVHAPAPRDISQDKVEFDEDNLTPVEKLKKERREAREARERLEKAAAASAVLQDVSDALVPGMHVRVEGLTSAAGSQMNGRAGVTVSWKADKERWEIRLDGEEGTMNVKPVNLVQVAAAAPPAAPATPAASPAANGGAAALAVLERAEASIAQLDLALRELSRGIGDLSTADGAADADGSFRAAARQLLSGHAAAINKLMAGLDELALGEVSDAAVCATARARKKAAAVTLEASLLPLCRTLRGQLDATPKVAEAAAAPLPEVTAPPSAPSAEVDSDEDDTPPHLPAAEVKSAEIDSDED